MTDFDRLFPSFAPHEPLTWLTFRVGLSMWKPRVFYTRERYSVRLDVYMTVPDRDDGQLNQLKLSANVGAYEHPAHMLEECVAHIVLDMAKHEIMESILVRGELHFAAEVERMHGG